MPGDSPLLPILLIHDGDLSDVADLLAHLGLQYTERRGAARREDEATSWELVIASPKRLLEFDPGASGNVPVRVAVLEKDSKTLRSMLQRAGIDLLIRRPVHPAALRLLILHCMYRGPEKRRALRVSIGARIKFRAGLRSRPAVLADLSTTGCRLLSSHRVAPDRTIKIHISEDVTESKPFSVSGTVVRTTKSDFPGIETLAVSFDRLRARDAERLRRTIASYARGPAMLPANDAALELGFPQREPAAATATQPAASAPPPAQMDAAEAPAEAPAAERVAETAPPSERRASPRHAYETRIVALGVEAARVLLGRDISLGGMRVESHPDLEVDDELLIGLHVRGRGDPVVVNARVIRDDAERGSVLQFFDLDATTQDYLTRMAQFLPILAVRENSDDAGIVVCEIMDHQQHPPTAN